MVHSFAQHRSQRRRDPRWWSPAEEPMEVGESYGCQRFDRRTGPKSTSEDSNGVWKQTFNNISWATNQQNNPSCCLGSIPRQWALLN